MWEKTHELLLISPVKDIMNLKEKYGTTYRVVDDGTDDSDKQERISCQEISGKYGAIYYYGRGLMAVRVIGGVMIGRVARLGLAVRQPGEGEAVFLFEPSRFQEVAGTIRLRRRRKLSLGARVAATERLRKLNLARLGRQFPDQGSI